VGALDVHAHMGPDSPEPSPRSIDAIDFAKMAKARGMRGFVIKQHFDESGPLAYLARKEVPGVEVFGGIVLNGPVGISAEAVRHMARVKGGWGRIVWMPTCGNGSMARACPGVPVARNGELLPAVKEVLGVIATTRTIDSNGELVLATGHLPVQEALMVIREAQAQGVKHIIVTHPISLLSWTVAQMQEAANMGAFIEITASAFIRERNAGNADPGKTAAEAIKKVGVEHCILSSDLGQVGNPSHPDGLTMAATWLRGHGFTNRDLDRMMKENPARLLGLPPP
jgi:hypothetical protein